ncbi:MAG: hypothetical protein COV79_04685 [Parcubacteria group bacterium CG11_big_fil_rev_8_21_14_0_20_41_14]|nr:MAG: hypothetical protein COV79_04685 [Parcubacteria group bacterium CG11_big_fil_rev_8_21_14_0_20_41_14]PIZ81442.1 MAG: hypothetical protein COY02_02015 [Parcubacteria group bacterium CG_4_10_14_0_2_um_filter_41_6]
MNALNLIPLAFKKNLDRERMFLLLHGIIGLIVVIIAFNTIMLTTARFVLISHYNKLKNNTYLVNSGLINIQNDVVNINKKISDAEKIQSDFTKLSHLISDAQNLIPNGIIVDFMYIDMKESALRFSGVSNSRETLLQFKNNLETASFIKKLDSPLSNFLDKEDINFRFLADLQKNIYNK